MEDLILYSHMNIYDEEISKMISINHNLTEKEKEKIVNLFEQKILPNLINYPKCYGDIYTYIKHFYLPFLMGRFYKAKHKSFFPPIKQARLKLKKNETKIDGKKFLKLLELIVNNYQYFVHFDKWIIRNLIMTIDLNPYYFEKPKIVNELTDYIKNCDYDIRNGETVYNINGLLTSYYNEERKILEKIKIEHKKSTDSYIDDSISILKSKERKFHNINISLTIIGGLSFVLAIVYLIWGEINIDQEIPITTNNLIYLFSKRFIIVGFFIGVTKFCFSLSKTYMNESLKNSDRHHAILFGKFFINTFKGTVTKDELKEVFKDWNINNESEFKKLSSEQVDPKFQETFIKTWETVAQLPKNGVKKEKSN